MTPHFSKLVNPIFGCVLDLLARIERGDKPNLQHERTSIRNEIGEAEATAGSPDFPVRSEDWQLAKRALIYWADEVLTQADSKWENHSLEFEYYGEMLRAPNFYVFGEREARNSSADVIETWYLAIVLGFKGAIDEGFYDHLNRDALPGGATDIEEGRMNWAKELRKQLRHTKLNPLDSSPVEGSVAILDGKAALRTTAGWFAVVLALACVLVISLILMSNG